MTQFVNEYVSSDNTCQVRSLMVFKDTEQDDVFGILTFANGENPQYVVSENVVYDTIKSHKLIKSR